MPYDQKLANRVRAVFQSDSNYTEQEMFGCTCFVFLISVTIEVNFLICSSMTHIRLLTRMSFFSCLSCSQALQTYFMLVHRIVGLFSMNVLVTCFSAVQLITWYNSSHAKHRRKSDFASFLHQEQNPWELSGVRRVRLISGAVSFACVGMLCSGWVVWIWM